MDETLALPSEKAAEIALRTQQILAYETGVANVVDPLGGSYYVENLTNDIEKKANKYFDQISKMGGVINGIESGYFQKEIANASSDYNNKLENNKRYVVGVNKFIKDDEKIDIPILEITDEVQSQQIKQLEKIKNNRNDFKIKEALSAITRACKSNDNILPLIIDAALQYATLGEIVDSMKTVFGEWNEQSII